MERWRTRGARVVERSIRSEAGEWRCVLRAALDRPFIRVPRACPPPHVSESRTPPQKSHPLGADSCILLASRQGMRMLSAISLCAFHLHTLRTADSTNLHETQMALSRIVSEPRAAGALICWDCSSQADRVMGSVRATSAPGPSMLKGGVGKRSDAGLVLK